MSDEDSSFQECTCSRAQLNIPMQTLFVDTTANQNGLSMIVITRDPTIWMNFRLITRKKCGGVSPVGLRDYMTHYKMFLFSFVTHFTGDLLIMLKT